jgi:gamma-glutamylcyclotransferase (GGCT)/AIG2-like uncharacterized protein YtfP
MSLVHKAMGLFTKMDPLWKKFAELAEQKSKFTPDRADLMQFATHGVFIYDSHQGTKSKHGNLGVKPVFHGHAYTESSDYVMYKKNVGIESFPFAMEISDKHRMGEFSSLIGDPGQIMGEVYELPTESIVALDENMLNTVYFNRKRVTVLVMSPEGSKYKSLRRIQTWMYVGNPEFWTDVIAKASQTKLISQSTRLFAAKEETSLGAFYVFDHKLDASIE